MELNYADLLTQKYDPHTSIHLSGLIQPESLKRLVSRTHTQDVQQYYELYSPTLSMRMSVCVHGKAFFDLKPAHLS